MSSSRGSSQPSDRTHVSYVSCIAGGSGDTWEALMVWAVDPQRTRPSSHNSQEAEADKAELRKQIEIKW